ncbi:hypothetical protein [Runella sp.]|uniref:hypothetical protein n=1 Tax=Runella sp. TaxID=1960881 RepID=UPI003D102E4D
MKNKMKLYAPLFFVFLLGMVFEQAKVKGSAWYFLLLIVSIAWLLIGRKLYSKEE